MNINRLSPTNTSAKGW